MADGVAGNELEPERLIGERIAGRFVVERLIGTGELSTAFRAYDDRLHRRVTVKLFHPRHRDDVHVVEAQLAAARAVARLSHEHVAMVIDRGEHEGRPLVVLEHVRGENLQERIERFAPLASGEIVGYALQIARALAYAHGHGVVHGNLRPGNVLLTEDREVKLVDFGGGSYVAQLVGDPFQAPELREVDVTAPAEPSDDVYALGALVFVALTEQAPQPGLEPGELQLLRPDVSPRLAAIVARALATNPADRFLSMREFAAELSGVREVAPAVVNDAFVDARQDTQPFAMGDHHAVGADVDDDTADGVLASRVVGTAAPRPVRRRREARRPRTGREVRARILAWSMVVLPLLALVIFGVMIAGERGQDQEGTDGRTAAPARPIEIAQVAAFDPEPGDGDEHSDTKDNVLDGDVETSWATDGYDTRDFNKLKPGVGLMVQLQQAADVQDVVIQTGLPGWTMEVRAADTPASTLDEWTPVSEPVGVSDGMKVPVDLEGESTQYLLVWITRLAIDTDEPNRARARIAELQVLGSPRSGSSGATDQ